MIERTFDSRMSIWTLNRIQALISATTIVSEGPARSERARASSEAMLSPRRSVPRGMSSV